MNNVPFSNIRKLYVNGEWVSPSAGGTQPVINPATEELLGEAPYGSKADAVAAIDAARKAFDNGPWPKMSMEQRIAIMTRFRNAISAKEMEIKTLLTAEVGSTFMLNETIQFGYGLLAFDYALKLAQKHENEQTPIEVSANLFNPMGPATAGAGVIMYEPYGVVAGITPFNFPFVMNLFKLIPALLAGNTMVLKPSPLTPFSALLLGEIADEAGLPKGVLNIVNGDDSVGHTLTTDVGVDLVTFTGSDKVGSAIMAQASATVKKLHLELGGKSALIVRHDADIEMAALMISANCCTHAGQGCALHTRAIVHNSIRPNVVELVKEILSNWSVGDPADPSNFMGPLINAASREKTERFVQLGLDSGATLVYGGKRPAELERGFFYCPTLFDNVDQNSTIAQEEIFGPVGVVIGFDNDADAIAIANNSKFGLHGGVLSGDKAKGFELARQIRTGQVWVNGGTGGLSMQAPFGGYKQSGFGRELGPHWLKEFMQQKAIMYPIG